MNIVELPEDVLLIIVKKLDFRAQYNLMQTCLCLQNIVSYNGVMLECDFSRSKLASIESFNLLFFHRVAPNLHELNLYAVSDLSLATLLPALAKLKQLKTLDVSFTNITVPDMRKIHTICPTIKNVTINLSFEERYLQRVKNHININHKILSKCRDIFKNFEKVGFVGSPLNILYTDIPLYLLEKAVALKEMNLTAVTAVTDTYLFEEEHGCKSLHCPCIAVSVRDWSGFEPYSYRSRHIYSFSNTNLYKRMNIQDKEFIIMKRNKQFGSIYISNGFKELIIRYLVTLYPGEYRGLNDCGFNYFRRVRVGILDNNPVRQKYLLSSSVEISRNSLMLFFDKTKTVFDEDFYSKILKQIEEFLPHYHDSPTYQELNEIESTSWNMVYVDGNKKLTKPSTTQQSKKMKPNEEEILDIPTLDQQLKNKNSIKMTIYCKLLRSPLSVSSTSGILSKITFLNLTGPDVRVDSEFLKVLFENATKLATLNIELHQPCSVKSIQCCTSLRHIRYVQKDRYSHPVNSSILKGLAKCHRLEIVQLIGMIFSTNYYPEVDDDLNLLIKECHNMYSLYLDEGNITQQINKLKKKYDRPYLNVVLGSGTNEMGYVAFKDVFELVPTQTCVKPDYMEDMFL